MLERKLPNRMHIVQPDSAQGVDETKRDGIG